MSHNTLRKRKKNYIALSFMLPVCGLLIVRLFCTLFFNGTYSLLYSDCYHQYYPFFLEFRRALRSGESLLYNWSVGLGMDYLGLAAYYLASPLNLVTVLLPESWMMVYFSALMPVKLGFASMFFAIFLKKIFRKNDFSIVLFGCFYGLCSWALGYQWNIMWLDTFALLPLVALGTVSLLKDKKFVLYTVSLFASVVTNYYIGLFTCIFVLLLFICYQICRWESFKKFLFDLLRIALYTILAIGMTAFLELPALAALQTTQSSINQFPTQFRQNITDIQSWKGIFDAMRQVAGNSNLLVSPTYKEGLPNVFCGLAANVFAFLFLTCRQVKLRDKLCAAFLLVFLSCSFIFRQLDYIWHGFHFTNQIPYRFSFLYSFVLLYMAYQAWTLRKVFHPWQIWLSVGLSLCLLLCSNDLTGFWGLFSGTTQLTSWQGMAGIGRNLWTILENSYVLLVNLIFLLLYGLVLLFMHRRRPAPAVESKRELRKWMRNIIYQRRLGTNILCAIMVLELAVSLAGWGAQFGGTDLSFYPRGKADSKAAIAYMQEREADTLFYRAETAHSQTLNDAALNGYDGVSTFTSSANVKVTEFMHALGYGARNASNRYCYEEGSPVSNLFLNLKYMIERDGSVKKNAYFDTVYTSGKVTLLENNAYLPLGFLADPQLINLEFDADDDYFAFQNNLLKAASGISENAWQPLSGPTLTILGSNVTLNAYDETGYCYYTATNSDCTITYSYTADKEGLMCFHLDQSKRNKFSVYVNGAEKPLYSETYSMPQMLSVCNVVPGDVVEIKLTCTNGDKGNISIDAAILDEQVFRQAYGILVDSTLELSTFKTTLVEGRIHCDRDGVLYTSIPQNGNWVAFVDDQPTQTVLIGDAMVGLILPEGEHTVRFEYHNKSFSLGWKISAACLGVFLVLAAIDYRHLFKRRKGKYEQSR